MRRTDFWERMGEVFGPAYATSVAKDQVLPEIGRTINTALSDGVDVQTIWRAVVSHYGDRVPSKLH